MIVCRSKSPRLQVAFSPVTFGMGKNAMGNPAAWPRIKFQDGSYVTSDDREIDFLKRHPRNGRDFWIETPQQAQESLSLSGEVAITSQDLDLRPSDSQHIEYLEKCYTMFPERCEALIESIEYLVKRFLISSITIPTAKDSQKKITSRIGDILDQLEQHGIWPVIGEADHLPVFAEGTDDRKRANRKG